MGRQFEPPNRFGGRRGSRHIGMASCRRAAGRPAAGRGLGGRSRGESNGALARAKKAGCEKAARPWAVQRYLSGADGRARVGRGRARPRHAVITRATAARASGEGDPAVRCGAASMQPGRGRSL